jgi:hypothetical protein
VGCHSVATRSAIDVSMTLTIRLATEDDLPGLVPLIEVAIDELQKGFIDEAQIRASPQIMGVDRQLNEDKPYYVVEDNGPIVGCGGWSQRATLYGADHSAGRSSRLLDPRAERPGSGRCTPITPSPAAASGA